MRGVWHSEDIFPPQEAGWKNNEEERAKAVATAHKLDINVSPLAIPNRLSFCNVNMGGDAVIFMPKYR